MAELYPFVNGVLGTDFLQLKTSDNIYLKDLLQQDLFPLLSLYNDEVLALEGLGLFNRFDDANANSKQVYASSVFKRISALEQPGMKKTMDSWNFPVPILRYGDATNITMEAMKQMTSKQIMAYAEATMIADKQNLIKQCFSAMCTKAPSAAVDELTSLACTPKAFWNDESAMDTPRTNGQYSFDGDHDHYLAYTSLSTNMLTVMAKVHEHEGMNGGQGIIFCGPGATGINVLKADTTYWKPVMVTSDILGIVGPDFNRSGVVTPLIAGLKKLGNNIQIAGTYDRAIVVETPDLPTYYFLYVVVTGPNSNLAPLGWREHPQFKGLQLWSDSGSNPIIGTDAQWRRYLGMSVWNRSAGAVAYIYSGNSSTWAEPTFA
jgi:hypothetical protein